MTPQEKAIAWIAEVGKEQAIQECKQAIIKLERQMDTKGYTPNDLAYLREYQSILKELQNTTNDK